MKTKIIQKVQANRQKKKSKENKIYRSSFSRTSLGSTDDGVHICKNRLDHICMSKGIVFFFLSNFSRAFPFLFDVMFSLGRSHSHLLRNAMSWIRGQQDASSLNYIYYLKSTASSDVSIQGRQWQPLSVHL